MISKNSKVLIVDDSLTNLTILKDILLANSLEVITTRGI